MQPPEGTPTRTFTARNVFGLRSSKRDERREKREERREKREEITKKVAKDPQIY